MLFSRPSLIFRLPRLKIGRAPPATNWGIPGLPTSCRFPHDPRRHRPLALNNRRLERIEQLRPELPRELHQMCFGDQITLAAVRQDEAPPSDRLDARFHAD